jgi:hypothetical protein
MGMMITLSVAVSLTLVAGAAVAQQTTGTINSGSAPAAAAPPPAMPLTGAAPEVGGPLISQPGPGLPRWRLYKNSSSRPQHSRSRE